MKRRNYRNLQETEYPNVRLALRNDVQVGLDDEGVEDLLAEMFPAATPEDIEGFMSTLRRVGRTVAPIAQRALPGMVQGAMQGGMVAGPWGALAGALGGGAASVLGGGRRPAPPTRPAPMPAAPSQVPAVGPAPGTGGAAALPQLLLLLSRPETMQALSSLLMSRSGRPTVAVGRTQVPAAAFANAIAETAARVAEGTGAPPAEDAADYLTDAYGSPRCDMANPAERADLLVWDLANAAAAEAAEQEADEEGEEEGIFDEAEDDFEEYGDPLDAYEAALEGEDFDDDN